MDTKAIKIKNLSKHFGQVVAVDNISFEVDKGEVSRDLIRHFRDR